MMTSVVILKDYELRMLLKAAFFLGFAITREGYNAECPYGHLAPAELFKEDRRVELLNNRWHEKGRDADWQDITFGTAFSELQGEALLAIYEKFGKEKVLPW